MSKRVVITNCKRAERRACVQVKMRLREMALTVDRFRQNLSVKDLEAMDRKLDRLALWLVATIRTNQSQVRRLQANSANAAGPR